VTLATLIALAMGFAHPSPGILSAIDTACRGEPACVADAVVYAAHESSLTELPKPWSWDAHAGISCGVWQQPCASLPRTVLGQARRWVALRTESLRRWGDLRAMPGDTVAGRRIALARSEEREDALYAARWAVVR
jgi:hypothetical protein